MTQRRETPIRSFGVSVFIIKPDGEGPRVLLLRRAGSLAGTWCQVAGGLEDGETAWQAALREIEEETALIPNSLYTADICEQFYEVDRDCITLVPVFVGYVSQDADVALNHEHDAFRWVTFEEAKKMVSFAGQREVLARVQSEFAERDPNPWLEVDIGI